MPDALLGPAWTASLNGGVRVRRLKGLQQSVLWLEVPLIDDLRLGNHPSGIAVLAVVDGLGLLVEEVRLDVVLRLLTLAEQLATTVVGVFAVATPGGAHNIDCRLWYLLWKDSLELLDVLYVS